MRVGVNEGAPTVGVCDMVSMSVIPQLVCVRHGVNEGIPTVDV